MTYPKNPYRLIKVLSLVKKEKSDIKVAIVGTGDLEEETKKMVVDYGLSENVSFLGFQKNPLKMLWDSKVMIMTSLWEGTPMCALEAVSLNVPIVSTPTDGLLEIVTNESIGYLSDDDSILSQRCLEIITNHKDKQIKVSKENNVVKNRKIIDDYKQVLLNIYEEGLKNE